MVSVSRRASRPHFGHLVRQKSGLSPSGLYSRFFQKVLHDAGRTEATEPFARLFTQGMIRRGGLVMAKSKGNGVAPDDLVSRDGANAARIYEMFIGPPDEDVEWSDAAIAGPVRFLQHVWRLVESPDSFQVTGSDASATVLQIGRAHV